MKVQIKRIDKSLPLPIYETKGSVGCDLLVREDTVIRPHQLGTVAGNVIIKTPKGYMVMLVSRSSTPRKKGLLTPHGFGVIDQDYCGPDDEYKVLVYNFTDQDVTIKRGEKIAQIVFVPIKRVSWEEVDDIKEKTRGGFGSTGGHKS